MRFSPTLFALTAAMVAAPIVARAEATVPQSVTELWADFDPRKDPLETEIVREWRAGGIVLRVVRFRVGEFKGRPAWLAAFYGFPEGATGRLPAVMHIHGGGQRASLDEVKALVARGYAALSVNWGGREMEGAQPGEANTDWGAVDPTQQNVPGYNSMLPGPKQFFEDREHPKNNNWYLLTLGCRRGLTFLEQQREVDPRRLGVHGFSMGGNLTMYVAGTDARVKAAVPAVGGQGWRWKKHDFIGGSVAQEQVKGDAAVFARTLSFESYAPLIRCPVLHRSGTNDFHGWMDDVYRTNVLIPNQPVRYAWAPHFNHRLTPEVAITMPLWLDHFLKGGPALPETPASTLTLENADGTPVLRVVPDKALPAARCGIFYSFDPDPRARFWRSADVVREGDAFTAKLPVAAGDAPLFAFANVFHTLPRPESFSLPGLPKEVAEVCLSTLLHRATAVELSAAKVRRSTAGASAVIDDFAHGWRDWYLLNAGNPDHWQNWTRKITDPEWRGPDSSRLAVTLEVAQTNRLVVTVVENEWRSYRGPRRTFVCEKEIAGQPGPQAIALAPADFRNSADGAPLQSWSQVDLLGLSAQVTEKRGSDPAPIRRWQGPAPKFLRVEWKK